MTDRSKQDAFHQRLLEALSGVDELTQQHAVLVEDPATSNVHLYGPFFDALTALRVAEDLRAQLLEEDPGSPVKTTIKPIYAVATPPNAHG